MDRSWRGETVARAKMAAWAMGLTHSQVDDLVRRVAILDPPDDWQDPDDWEDSDEREDDNGLGLPLHIACRQCGQSLGNYFVGLYGDFISLVPKGRLGNWKRGRLRSDERTDGGSFHYEWTCGCGAKGYRRADRIGALPVTPDVESGGWLLVL
jgi:hypothetical protein